ncbi:hypothetical protein CBL_20107 [Carabus blaptoides fortunei]
MANGTKSDYGCLRTLVRLPDGLDGLCFDGYPQLLGKGSADVRGRGQLVERESYSGRKKASVATPFTMYTTNGFLADLTGPFTGNINDAEILLQIMKSSEEISKILSLGIFLY